MAIRFYFIECLILNLEYVIYFQKYYISGLGTISRFISVVENIDI